MLMMVVCNVWMVVEVRNLLLVGVDKVGISIWLIMVLDFIFKVV